VSVPSRIRDRGSRIFFSRPAPRFSAAAQIQCRVDRVEVLLGLEVDRLRKGGGGDVSTSTLTVQASVIASHAVNQISKITPLVAP
jgi:hypothetical protein